jgi:hypothetical protein
VTIIKRGNDISGAEFSRCEKYRFSLWRTWTDKGLDGRLCAFIGLNPSTATESLNDPTITRCIRFCKDWGYDGYVMLNLFGFRATDPKVMKAQFDPDGRENNKQILRWTGRAKIVVCAWGIHGKHMGHGQNRRNILDRHGVAIHHLGLTKAGLPKHPLYLKADTKPVPWPPCGVATSAGDEVES